MNSKLNCVAAGAQQGRKIQGWTWYNSTAMDLDVGDEIIRIANGEKWIFKKGTPLDMNVDGAGRRLDGDGRRLQGGDEDRCVGGGGDCSHGGMI